MLLQENLLSTSDLQKSSGVMANAVWILSFWTLSYFCAQISAVNKYAKDLNTGSNSFFNDDRPFRMNKLNLIWEKARKKLPNKRLEELHDELLVQDKLELELKHKKLNDKPDTEDGELEAAVRNKWFDILYVYGLADSFGEFDKEFGDILKDKNRVHKFNPHKLDPKLMQLWKNAEKSGFTDDELDEFKKELIHQQRKMNEYNLLLREMDTMEQYSENSIEPLKDDGEVLEFKKKKQALKEKHRQIRKEFDFLDQQIDRKMELTDSEFKEPKVIVMWNMALKANFSDEELASLKEELKHFEHKVEKHRYLKEDLQESEDKYRKKGKEDHEFPQRHLDLQDRVDEYHLKVKKYELDLKAKIAKQLGKHTEL